MFFHTENPTQDTTTKNTLPSKQQNIKSLKDCPFIKLNNKLLDYWLYLAQHVIYALGNTVLYLVSALGL